MEQNRKIKKQGEALSGVDIRFWIITALFTALTYLFTAFVNITLPGTGSGGLIHLGNIPLFIAAIIYGKKTGAIAGGIGMGMFDLMSPWAVWTPFTIIIVGLMGFVTGAITEKHKTKKRRVLAVFVALLIKVVGYYIAEGIIYGNWIAPVLSVPANFIQVVVAAVLVFPIVGRLKILSDKIMG